MQELWSGDAQDIEHELALLHEWEGIQRDLLTFALTTSPTKSLSWRDVIDTHIARSTKGRARLYWEPLAVGNALGCDRFCEVRYQETRYGFLGLTPGYLASRYFPEVPQDFAHLCALVLAFIEYQALVHYQLDSLPPLFPGEHIDRLTRRERDVLLGLMRGASDVEMAQSLGIEPTTVHTHRKRLYRRLAVHSAQEATLRCFTHRLIDWFEVPCSDGKEDMPAPFDREADVWVDAPVERRSGRTPENEPYPMHNGHRQHHDF
jgi:DNA-binding CsgD family transcriptional regulator